MKLVIIETPAQAKTLAASLGEGWRIEPCYGFVRDLPPNTLGVEVDAGFRPTFSIAPGKGGIVIRLKKALREADAIYAATPPGCDGEAMVWHVLALLPEAQAKLVYRVMLDALTPGAIRDAFASPLPLDMNRVDAALTTRIADRIAGFTVSAAASGALNLKTGLTYAAMVTLRLLDDRELRASSTYWSCGVRFSLGDVSFDTKVLNAKGRPLALQSRLQTDQLTRMLEHSHYWVEKLGGTTRAIPAPDPLTLAALIELASREFDLSATRTVALVATLYEAGWITHPDGIPLPDATRTAQVFIEREYGAGYLASSPAISNGIAPTEVTRQPEHVPGDGAALYGLIWRHFVAAHMVTAQERITAARIRVGPAHNKPYPVTLLAQSGCIAFDGWMRVFKNREPDETADWLPLLKEGLAFSSAQAGIVLEQRLMAERFTEPALAATLVHSGFSAQVAVEAGSDLLDSGLIAAADRALAPTGEGLRIASYFKESFRKLTDPTYAAEFFTGVEAVAAGEQTRAGVLTEFWSRCTGADSEPEKAGETQSRKPVTLHPLEEA